MAAHMSRILTAGYRNLSALVHSTTAQLTVSGGSNFKLLPRLHPGCGLPERGRQNLTFLQQAANLSTAHTCKHQPVTNKRCLLVGTSPLLQQNRQRITIGLTTGEPETVQEVPDRFFRLHNGMWIRTIAGRNKKKWRKSLLKQHRQKQHLFCNRTQCRLLDRMVNMEYKKKKFYPDDPYEPYHKKSNLPDYKYVPPRFLP